MPEPHSDPRPRLSACPLCAHTQLDYQFTHLGSAIVRCAGCGLLMRSPQPSDAELAAIYSEHYFLGHDGRGRSSETDALKRATGARQLDEIESRLPGGAAHRAGLRLLEVGPGLGNLLAEAAARGYDIAGVDASPSAVHEANAKLGGSRVVLGDVASLATSVEPFDVVVLADVIEHTRDPLAELLHIRRLLKPGGLLFLAVPSLDSWSARLMRERWMEFKVEHLFFFDSQTIRSLLFRAGFGAVSVVSGWKTLSPEYVVQHFERFPVPVVSPLARALRAVVPVSLRRRHVSVVASGIDVVARRLPEEAPVARLCALSVIMPVLDEAATFPTIFEQVYAKEIPGVTIDITIVESRSSDGTREQVQAVANRPRVHVILEDQPRGKGHAVRAALKQVTGDLVLIQDGDLEYDVDDYNQLVAPLLAGRAAVVLGVRHDRGATTWKMRQFAESWPTRFAMRLGHAVFRGLFNIVYGQRLHDPFTMFKVFRRDAVLDLDFDADGFDFDWELLAKLVRSGYQPLEIPVNYRSRTFAEGKKVSLWRDPIRYLIACIKYRFQPLGSRGRYGTTSRTGGPA